MKFLEPIKKEYGEIDQRNPIRWELFYLNEANELEPQTAQFKCKDFLNDVVGWYYDKKGVVYGFNTHNMKFNDEGVYIRVSNIKHPLQWLTNVENTLQKPLEQALGVRLDITLLDLATYLIFVPKTVFSKTYYISLASFLIRISNNDYLYESIEQVFTDRNGPVFDSKKENTLDQLQVPELAKAGFNLPTELTEYWYYANANYNSSNSEFDITNYISILHANGMCDWAKHFPNA